MRSGVGAFCPRSRRCDFFDDFARCEELRDLEEADFFCVALCACAEAAHAPNPAATSSIRARWVAFGTRMCVSVLAVAKPLLLIVGRYFARQIKRQDPVAVLSAKNLEYHILAMLQF